MSTKPAIQIQGLGKQYLLGGAETHEENFREMMTGAITAPFRKLRRLGGKDETQERIWALKDVSLDVQPGEAVGIIGRNGAGKSTLLKILSRITEPTEGKVLIRGRLASLLEVGTGFHPELTGRENIYLNGAILGMTRKEIQNKFDEIVDFAEIEKFLDTPVKRYSSGMYVRLAFAVAAHLEPEILVVDEVLAVGDAAFQKKCLGKMGDVAGEGRTILFVSHNMAAINKLCTRSVLLQNGEVELDGESGQVTRQYLKLTQPSGLAVSRVDQFNSTVIKNKGNCDQLIIKSISVSGEEDETGILRTGGRMLLEIAYERKKEAISPAFVVQIRDPLGTEVLRFSTQPISGFDIDRLHPSGSVILSLNELPLVAGIYYIDVGFVRESFEWLIKLETVITIDVQPHDYYSSGMALDQSRGLVVTHHHWEHKRA